MHKFRTWVMARYIVLLFSTPVLFFLVGFMTIDYRTGCWTFGNNQQLIVFLPFVAICLVFFCFLFLNIKKLFRSPREKKGWIFELIVIFLLAILLLSSFFLLSIHVSAVMLGQNWRRGNVRCSGIATRDTSNDDSATLQETDTTVNKAALSDEVDSQSDEQFPVLQVEEVDEEESPLLAEDTGSVLEDEEPEGATTSYATDYYPNINSLWSAYVAEYPQDYIYRMIIRHHYVENSLHFYSNDKKKYYSLSAWIGKTVPTGFGAVLSPDKSKIALVTYPIDAPAKLIIVDLDKKEVIELSSATSIENSFSAPAWDQTSNMLYLRYGQDIVSLDMNGTRQILIRDVYDFGLENSDGSITDKDVFLAVSAVEPLTFLYRAHEETADQGKKVIVYLAEQKEGEFSKIKLVEYEPSYQTTIWEQGVPIDDSMPKVDCNTIRYLSFNCSGDEVLLYTIDGVFSVMDREGNEIWEAEKLVSEDLIFPCDFEWLKDKLVSN